jgi:hypothetical protein
MSIQCLNVRCSGGRWEFVGVVPVGLAFKCGDSHVLALACTSGEGVARQLAHERRVGFWPRTWLTRGQAVKAALCRGYEVVL